MRLKATQIGTCLALRRRCRRRCRCRHRKSIKNNFQIVQYGKQQGRMRSPSTKLPARAANGTTYGEYRVSWSRMHSAIGPCKNRHVCTTTAQADELPGCLRNFVLNELRLRKSPCSCISMFNSSRPGFSAASIFIPLYI